MDVTAALQEKLTSFDETWINDIPPQSNHRLWKGLRTNAVNNVREKMTALRPLEDNEVGWRACLLEAVRENASTLSNYRGSLCGAETCVRIDIALFVLIQTLLQMNDETSKLQLIRIAEEENCPEIKNFINGKRVR